MQFNNLVIGKIYELKFQAYITSQSASAVQLRAIHDSNIIAELLHENNQGSGDDEHISGTSIIFEATASTVIFEAAGMNVVNDRIIAGEFFTFAVLTERNDLGTETTDFS